MILNGLLWFFSTTSTLLLLVYNSFAYSIGAINSFLLNKYWTFGQRQRTTRAELFRFTLITLCGIAWSSSILWLAGLALHSFLANATLWANASKLVAIAGTALISYLGMRLWVFVSKRPEKHRLLNATASAPANMRDARRFMPVSSKRESAGEHGPHRPGAYANERPGRQSLSVVLPAYNEEQVIASTVCDVLDVLSAWRVDAEVLVVNDGSTDRTGANPRVIARAFRELFISARKWRRVEQAHAQHIFVSEHRPY